MSMRYIAGFISAYYNPIKIPSAPIIGTASDVGGGVVSVAFTPPAGIAAESNTSYVATSTPSGITASATSSPITVSGLAIGTPYTFTVYATNVYGVSPLSASSNSVTSLPVIGAAYGGGFFAGQISTTANGVATHNLVVGPVASAQATKGYQDPTATTGATSAIDGPANTATLVASGTSTRLPAAHFCNDLVTGGFSDWYMPARNELEVCYYFLKPTTGNNDTSTGSNANAVSPEPISTNYTSGAPARTSATAFQSGGTEAFDSSGIKYWASTESSATQAWIKRFSDGYVSSGYGKGNTFLVRAIRRVAV